MAVYSVEAIRHPAHIHRSALPSIPLSCIPTLPHQPHPKPVHREPSPTRKVSSALSLESLGYNANKSQSFIYC